MRVGETIFYIMKNLGIRQIFGNPGTTELSFLRQMPGDFTYYLALHDGVAVGMAEGYYLATKKPQIVNLHSTPGLTNALSFINEAYVSRIPLIVLVGQQYSNKLVDEPILYGDFIKISAGVVKSAFEIRSESEAVKVFIRAYKESITPPYGPVLISLPQDVAEKDAGDQITIPKHFVGNLCDEATINYVINEINSVNSLAIVAGYEIALFDANEELRKLAEKLNVPVYNEPYMSISPFDSTHPLFKGSLSRYHASDVMKELEKYELILVLGGWLNYVVFPDVDLAKLNVIEVTYDYKEATRRQWDTIVCSPKDFIIKLTEKVNKKFSFTSTILSEREKDQDNFLAEIFRELNRYMEKYVIFSEAPTHRDLLINNVKLKASSFYNTRSGLLGWGLSAGVGYSLYGNNVIAIIGDGSFNYSPQALWSAVKYEGKVKVIVINNKGYRSLAKRGIEADWLSPHTSPWKIALGYGFEAKELKDPKRDVEWLMGDDKRKLLEIVL
ncbi:thiamine pyrophosphate-binding protein [Sulfolobus tengchongensis]|uniref:2-oxoacid oxidoreductase (ferredoxin) n=1 Tax=Sulfolobus tengchongensis TaxID=207809 RepID=A0AAX4KZ66_9CREN